MIMIRPDLVSTNTFGASWTNGFFAEGVGEVSRVSPVAGRRPDDPERPFSRSLIVILLPAATYRIRDGA